MDNWHLRDTFKAGEALALMAVYLWSCIARRREIKVYRKRNYPVVNLSRAADPIEP